MTRAVVTGLALAGLMLLAQPTAKSLVGTVAGVKAESAQIEVRPDHGEAVLVKFGPDTLVQRVAPGEQDLKEAESITAADLAVHDRVLVTFVPGSPEARRIVVMSAMDIEKRRQTQRQDWIERGFSGVVASVKGTEITLRTRSFQGAVTPAVTVNEKTVFRQYAPDSVRFADAVLSTQAKIRPGDQLRARGQKSPDGLHVTAEEVVFGTFLTKVGQVTSVNMDAGEVRVKDLETNKSIVIKLTADSQIKRMPAGPPLMGAPGGAVRPPVGFRPGPPHDLSQMLERMPAATLADLKAGETVVVSSTRGASSERLTAIMLLANADVLIRMATVQSSGSRPEGLAVGMGMEGMAEGVAGLELPGMIP